jgi:hypothetical protein
MPTKHDYVPSQDGELLTFAKNLYAYALVNYARWSVPSPQAMLEAPITAFETALAVFSNPNHGKVDTLNKNEAKAALTHGLRAYVQGFVARNPGVTDEDKEKMALPLRDTMPTQHPVPDVRPETEAEPSGRGKHTVTAINPHTRTKEKPPLVAGAAFACRVRAPEEPKLHAEDMPSEFQAGAVKVYQWAEADYGKMADYATAYENSTGKRGPWSNVTSLLISG